MNDNYSTTGETPDKNPSDNETPDQLLATFLTGKKVYSFEKGESIVSQGDLFRGLFFIRKGFVKIIKEKKNEETHILWFAKKGDILGMDDFFDRAEKYTFSAVAEEQCSTVFIPKSDFEKVLKSNPDIYFRLIKILSKKIDFMEGRITSIFNKKANERLAELLLFLAYKGDIKNKEFIGHPSTIEYSLKDLANIAGTTKNYLYKLLVEFSNKNLIEMKKKKLMIKDHNKLYSIVRGKAV